MVEILIFLGTVGTGSRTSFDVTVPSGRTKPEQLKISARARSTRDTASVVLSTELYSQGTTFRERLEDSVTSKYGATVEYVIPIRLRGTSYPGVAVKIRRPNWFDFHLWVTVPDRIEQVFSFSCRDENAVRWRTAHGALLGIETIDRYASVPEHLRKKESGKNRWAQLDEFAWSPKMLRFLKKSKSWRSMPYDKSLPPQIESLPDKFTFRWISPRLHT